MQFIYHDLSINHFYISKIFTCRITQNVLTLLKVIKEFFSHSLGYGRALSIESRDQSYSPDSMTSWSCNRRWFILSQICFICYQMEHDVPSHALWWAFRVFMEAPGCLALHFCGQWRAWSAYMLCTISLGKRHRKEGVKPYIKCSFWNVFSAVGTREGRLDWEKWKET